MLDLILHDGKLSPLQAESTRNASSPTHMSIMTSQTPTNRGPSPKMVPLPALETPPVREYQHHKKAMITSSTQLSRSSSSSPENVTSPVSIITSHPTPYTPSDGEVMSPDSGMSSASSSPETPTIDDNNNNTTTLPRPLVNSTGTPLAPPGGPPFKRRPGRPPGSTKKFKNPYAREYRRKSDSDSNNDFSLRKFFEAGGRDYNEYLEWLKKKGHAQTNGMQPTPVSVAPQYTTVTLTPASPAIQSYARAPVYPTTSVSVPQGRPAPGPQSPLPPIQIPAVSQPMTHGPGQVPSPHMLPPGYRPILIPRTPLPPGVRPGEMLPFVPGFTMVPMQGQPPIQPPSQKSPTTPHIDVFSALDLSAKHRRMEPEIPHDLNDRLRPDVPYQTRHLVRQEEHHQVAQFQRDLPKETRIPVNHEEPTSPTRIPSDEVESSTPEVDLSSWDIENVVKFVTTVPGCTEYADTFREHKIDGATLPHLSESHLLNFVKMKLGPAIRLRLAISRLKCAC